MGLSLERGLCLLVAKPTMLPGLLRDPIASFIAATAGFPGERARFVVGVKVRGHAASLAKRATSPGLVSALRWPGGIHINRVSMLAPRAQTNQA